MSGNTDAEIVAYIAVGFSLGAISAIVMEGILYDVKAGLVASVAVAIYGIAIGSYARKIVRKCENTGDAVLAAKALVALVKGRVKA